MIFEMCHKFSLVTSILFWLWMFYQNKCKKQKRNNIKIENAMALINNIQLVILISLETLLFSDTKNVDEIPFLVSFVYTPSLNGKGSLSFISVFSTYFSLTYNLFDIFNQVYNKKYVFVLHHSALMPFFIGYLYGGYYYNLQFIYGLLEVSSCTYNLREIFPELDKFHKVVYLLIRSICTPLLIKVFLEDFWNVPLYLNLITSLSIFLLVIFNFVSIKLTLKSLKVI